jgi:hypothetical protein
MNSELWMCAWCGGGAEDEDSLRDHQQWCLGDARANTRMLDEIASRDGGLSQEALVAAARKRRADKAHTPTHRR